MKATKFLIILLLPLFLVQGVKGQEYEFAPVGATWWYTFDASWGFPPQITFQKIKVIGDTIIKNKTCKILGRCISSNCFSNIYSHRAYIYDSIGYVFWYIESIDSFSLLYNFNANMGESWDIVLGPPHHWPDTITVEVISVGFQIINGYELKDFILYTLPNTHPQLGDHLFVGKTIEFLGNMNWMFPIAMFEDPSPGPLRCYEDNTLGLYKRWDSLPCDSSWLLNIEAHQSNIQIIVFPTLCDNYVTVKITNDIQISGPTIYRIYNVYGKLVQEGKLENNEQKIYLELIPNGFYFLFIKNDNFKSTHKFIKI